MRIHDLRHNFTSQLQAAGVSDSIIMAITGHKTHVMLHRYSHANDEYERKAIDVLPTVEHKPGGNVITLLANRS
jgi:integrase